MCARIYRYCFSSSSGTPNLFPWEVQLIFWKNQWTIHAKALVVSSCCSCCCCCCCHHRQVLCWPPFFCFGPLWLLRPGGSTMVGRDTISMLPIWSRRVPWNHVKPKLALMNVGNCHTFHIWWTSVFLQSHEGCHVFCNWSNFHKMIGIYPSFQTFEVFWRQGFFRWPILVWTPWNQRRCKTCNNPSVNHHVLHVQFVGSILPLF